MNFVYEDDFQLVLQAHNVNGKNGFVLYLDDEAREDDDDLLIFQSLEAARQFVDELTKLIEIEEASA